MAADHGHPQPPEAAQPPFGARNRLTGSPGRIVARHPDGQHTANKRPALTLRLFATATAVGESPVYVKGQIGHTDATLTLNYYAREMDRRDDEPERLNALVEGRELVATGSAITVPDPVEGDVEPVEPVNSDILPE